MQRIYKTSQPNVKRMGKIYITVETVQFLRSLDKRVGKRGK